MYYNVVMEKISLQVLTSPNCTHCHAFLLYWQEEGKKWPNVAMSEVSVMTPEGQTAAMQYHIFASPGIIINNELFASGGFDKKELEEKLTALSNITI